MKIGIIGSGAIATYVVDTIKERSELNLEVTSMFVQNKEKYAHFQTEQNITLYTDIEAFLDSDIDMVVEAANVSAVESLLPTVIKKKNAIIISIGAFVDDSFATNIKELAQKHQHSIYLPSGAIGGLDLIQHAQQTETLSSVTLETRKPAHTLTDENIDIEKVVFDGTAQKAIKQYPKNINVAIALGLAGVGIEQTNVKIIADPNMEQNQHTITAEGAFGKASIQVDNAPMPTNTNTSYLAAMSVIGTLTKRTQYIQIG